MGSQSLDPHLSCHFPPRILRYGLHSNNIPNLPFWLSTHVLVPRNYSSKDNNAAFNVMTNVIAIGSSAERIYFPPKCQPTVIVQPVDVQNLSCYQVDCRAWVLVLTDNCSLHLLKGCLSENTNRQLRHETILLLDFATVTQNSVTQREERPGRGIF